MARPSKLTPQVQAEIVRRVEEGVSPEVAARAGGIAPSTYYRWMVDGAAQDVGPFREFREAVKTAEAVAEAHCLGIVRLATIDHWQAAAWWLERRRPERWASDRRKKRAEIELLRARRDAVVDEDEVLAHATPEELAAIRDVVARVKARRRGVG